MSANNFSTHRGRQRRLGNASAALADALCIRPVAGMSRLMLKMAGLALRVGH